MTDPTETPTVTLTVGQVAEQFGITRRTLHHYDDIGLVVPSERSHAGYRLYTHEDLTRLQHVVVYRRLEFALDEIASLLDGLETTEGSTSLAAHLRRQREAVATRLDELHRLVQAIDDALEQAMSDQQMTPAQMKELFGDTFEESYAAEAEQRWGDTDAWRQSQERTKHYGRTDWEQVKAETDAVNAAIAACMDQGAPADGEQAAAAAEQHRASIERFYDCSYEFHVSLAQMYVCDPRFTATYDAVRPGMARYLHDAIVANAARHGVAV